MMFRASFLSFMVSIFALQVISENPIPISNKSSPFLETLSRTPSPIFETLSGTGHERSPILGAVSQAGREPSPILRTLPGTGYFTGPGSDRALSTTLSSSQSNCGGCEVRFETENAPWAWATPTVTLQVLIDNSTSITSNWTIQGQLSTFETDVSIGLRKVGNEVRTVPLEEKVHLIHPTLYHIFHGFIKYTTFPEYITILNRTRRTKSDFLDRLESSSRLCRSTKISYTNVFAVPLVDGVEVYGSALSNFESFFPTVENNCIRHGRTVHAPMILEPVSALTTTRTSFTSLAKSPIANPSPSPILQNPLVSATAPDHTQNTVGTPHSDDPSPKLIISQVSQSVSDPPPVHIQAPTLSPKPQPAAPKEQSIQHNSNLPLITLDDSIITANSLSRFVIDGETLRPGGPEITVSGTPISLAPSATNVVIGGDTVKLAQTRSPLFKIPGRIITPDMESRYLIDGQTLIPGSKISASGTIISLAPSASEVVIGSSTLQLLAPSPLSLPFFTVGDKIFAPDSASQYIIDGQTLKAGSPAITVSGMPISLAPSASNVVIGGSTILLATAPITAHGFAFGGKSIFLNSASEYVVDSQTIIPGAPAVTVSGTPISLDQSASSIVIGGTTIALTGSATPLLPLTIDRAIIIPNSASENVIGTQTLIPGASGIIVSGTHFSLAPFATAVIVGGKTIPLTSSPTTTTALPLITIGNSVITPNAASQYVIAGQTLVPGGPAITVSGTRISLAPSASDVVIGGSTIPLATAPITGQGLTFGEKSIFLNSASEYVIGTQTLIPGASGIIVSGTLISLVPFATAVIVGGKTIPLTSSPTITTALPLITIGNSVITPNAASQYVIAGQTLVPGGPAITVSGTRISLAPQATDVVIGTSTEGLSRLILTAYGSTAAPSVTVNGGTSATGPAAFRSVGTKICGRRWISAFFIFGYGVWGWL